MAVQLAKMRGARVVAVAPADSREFLRELGADQIVPFEQKVKEIDFVLDTIGGDAETDLFATLKKGGVLVSTANRPNALLATQNNVTAKFSSVRSDAAMLTELTKLFDRGSLILSLAAQFPLSEAAQAQKLLETSFVQGKIALMCI